MCVEPHPVSRHSTSQSINNQHIETHAQQFAISQSTNETFKQIDNKNKEERISISTQNMMGKNT